MDLIDKYLGEAYSQNTPPEIITAIQRKGKKVANDPFDINKAYFNLDGTVYKAGVGKGVVNMGDIKSFIKKVKTGKLKAKLVEGKTSSTQMECMECGHKFKKKIGKKTFEVKCPKCKGYDTDIA